MMLDRQFLGDVALALLIALPSSMLVRPVSVPRDAPALSTDRETSRIALATTGDRQVGLFR
jgi:hypothetical protein